MLWPTLFEVLLVRGAIQGNSSMNVLLTSLSILLLGTAITVAQDYRVVCYFGSWAVYRPDNGKFDVEDIDPTLCTHLIYGFVGLGEDNSIKVLDSWNELPDNYGKDAFGRFVKLKERSPNTKTMVAIGGWNEGSTKYSNMAATEASRNAFADNAVAFLKKYQFDGLDIDWEYPNQRGGVAADKDNYVALLQTVYSKFQAEGFILSAAVGASAATVEASYNVPEVSKNVDFINLMTYDFHGSWDTTTGENAPLYAAASDADQAFNVDACLQNWLKLGAPAEKINLGMGTYGHNFVLASTDNTGINAPITGPGPAGPYTRQSGTLGYNEICEPPSPWQEQWSDEQQVPYAINGNQWVGYDNVKSIGIKSQYVKDNGLGGAMIWSVETDDFRGLCGGGKNPLLNTINSVLNNGVLPTLPPRTTTTRDPNIPTDPTTPSTPPPPTPTPPPQGLCTQAGYVRDPSNCQVFYQCVPDNGKYDIYKFMCGDGTYFDPSIDECNFTDQVPC